MKLFDSQNPTNIIRTILIILCLIGMVFVQAVGFSLTDSLQESLLNNTLARVFGGLAFFGLLWSFGYEYLKPFQKPFLVVLLITLPAWIVAINNLPISAMIRNRTTLTATGFTIFLFELEALSVGFFEEIVFRGVLLVVLLQRLPQTKKGTMISIVLSAAIFALVHLFNVFAGAAIDATLLQVGYSFLMGLLWAVVFLATGSIWSAIGIHALYNFTGMLFVTVGTMYHRFDAVTIVVTVFIGALTAGYYLRLILNMDQQEITDLITPSKANNNL